MNRANKNKCDVHFFTDFDEYEYIQRVIFNPNISIAEACRNKWFTVGWKQRLNIMREKQRNQGIEDQRFWHKKQIEQEKK